LRSLWPAAIAAAEEIAAQKAIEANRKFLNTAAPRSASDWDSLLAGSGRPDVSPGTRIPAVDACVGARVARPRCRVRQWTFAFDFGGVRHELQELTSEPAGFMKVRCG
jgi:hypothetical protein